MNESSSKRSIPMEAIGVLTTAFLLPVIGVVAGVLLPVITRLKMPAFVVLYWTGLASGLAGVVLMFLARLPEYRKGRFWTVGSRDLDPRHRRLYWIAFVLMALSILILGGIWLRVPEVPWSEEMIGVTRL